MTDNYIRIGYGKAMSFIFFDSKDTSMVDSLRAQVEDLNKSRLPVAMWKPVNGLSYPIVGGGGRFYSSPWSSGV